MQASILVLRGTWLLLVYVLCTSLTSGKRCVLYLPSTGSLEQDSGYLSSIYCNVRRGLLDGSGRSVSRVEIDVAISKPMNGWEFTVQFATKTDLQVSKLRGGELVVVEYPEKGTVTFRDRKALLEAGDSFHLTFRVSYRQEDIRLFPATVQLDEPSPIRTDGMCGGNIARSPITSVIALTPKSKSRYRVTMAGIQGGGESNVMVTCRLSFAFPVRLLVIHHAEFVGNKQDTDYVIALNGASSSDLVVLEYERHRVKNGYAYLHTLCRTCIVDPTKSSTSSGSGEFIHTVTTNTQSISPGPSKCPQYQNENPLQKLIWYFIRRMAVPITGGKRPPHHELSLTSVRWAGRNMFEEADKNFDNVLSYNEIMQYSTSLLERNFSCTSFLTDRCTGGLTEPEWFRCWGV